MEWMFAGTGAAATRLRSVDWGATLFGDPTMWPSPVRTAIQICLCMPTPALVIWRDLVFANDACDPMDQIDGPSSRLREQAATLFGDRSWLRAGCAELADFGVALPIVDEDGELLAITALEDRPTFAHRVRDHLGPMRLTLDLLRNGLLGPHLDVLDAQVQALAASFALGGAATPNEAAAPTPPQRILVVEDDDATARALRGALVNLGHVVELAHDSAVAIAVAKTFAPELVLVDIGLPIVDGWELSSRLRSLGISPPRFVAVTGRGDDADLARSRDAGFTDHLVKPVDVAQLIRVVGATA